jgi:hypothetical protein
VTRGALAVAAAGAVASWYWLPWFSAAGETFTGRQSFEADRFLLLGTLVSWGEIAIFCAGIAGICALAGDRFGAVLSFLAFAPLYVAAKYTFFSTPAGLPDGATEAWGLWLVLLLAVGMAIAGFGLEAQGDDEREQSDRQPEPPDDEHEKDYKPWRL